MQNIVAGRLSTEGVKSNDKWCIEVIFGGQENF
jgi:hypothetical protein